MDRQTAKKKIRQIDRQIARQEVKGERRDNYSKEGESE